MKLAEALMERSDLNIKIDQLEDRIRQNVLIQEGEKANEDPQELMHQLDDATARLEYLMAKINLTNCTTSVNGKTLTEIIAEKDAKLKQLDAYRSIARAASSNTNRARSTEIIIKTNVSVTDLRKKCDDLAKEIRLLDNALQMTNWSSDLVE